jgi:hypothetical protein
MGEADRMGDLSSGRYPESQTINKGCFTMKRPDNDMEPLNHAERKFLEEALTQTLWEVFYHMELDKFAKAIVNNEIDGNDHPAFREVAKAIIRRMP